MTAFRFSLVSADHCLRRTILSCRIGPIPTGGHLPLVGVSMGIRPMRRQRMGESQEAFLGGLPCRLPRNRGIAGIPGLNDGIPGRWGPGFSYCAFDLALCARGDLNPHARRHRNLNPACLPISPLAPGSLAPSACCDRQKNVRRRMPASIVPPAGVGSVSRRTLQAQASGPCAASQHGLSPGRCTGPWRPCRPDPPRRSNGSGPRRSARSSSFRPMRRRPRQRHGLRRTGAGTSGLRTGSKFRQLLTGSGEIPSTS